MTPRRLSQLRAAALAIAGALLQVGCAAPDSDRLRSPINQRTALLLERELSNTQQVASLQRALEQSMIWLASTGAAARFPVAGIDQEQALASVRRFAAIIREQPPSAAARIIREEFDVLAFSPASGRDVLFTGYFAPEFPGSLTETAEFRYPLHQPPPVPKAHARREIEKRRTLRGWEIVWLRDRFDRYVVHVNGSARIRLPDGLHVNISHAATNEMPYTSIGRLLIDDGVLLEDEMSLQAIRAHFRAHPGQFEYYAWQNDRYVFFEILADDQWPRASTGVRLTSMRSIATDHTVYPAGCVVMIDLRDDDSAAYPHLVVNQDTGGAIIGPHRADLFIGVGDDAGEFAGGLIAHGTIRVLILKEN